MAIGLADVEDFGGRIPDGGDIVDDQRIAGSQVVDVLLGDSGDGGIFICLGTAGDAGDGGFERDTDLIRVDGGAGSKECYVVVDHSLHVGQ